MAVTRMPGVLDAYFSYEEGSGVVTYDPALTSPETFLPRLTDATGYGARVVAGPVGAPADGGGTTE